MKLCLFGSVFFLNFYHFFAQWIPSKYPNPVLNPELCNRSGVKQSWICDPDSVLTQQNTNLLEGLVKEIYLGQNKYALSFECSGVKKGLQIGVAIVNSMSSATNEKLFAETIHDKWGVGDQGCDNGVLIFVAIQNRKIYISTGKGAVKLLPDKILHEIIDFEIKPYFLQQNYLKGLQSAIIMMGLYVNPEVSKTKLGSRSSKGDGIGGWLIPLVIFGWIASFAWNLYSKRKQNQKYNKAKEALKKLQDDFEKAKKQKYISTTCPICFVELEDQKKDKQGKDQISENQTKNQAEGGPSSSSSAPPENQPLLDNNNTENQQDENNSRRKRFYLPCGHCFCEPCIMEWLNNHKTCPVCRKPIDSDDHPPGPTDQYTPPRGSCSGGTATPQGMGQTDYFPEFVYRLNRIQYFYPDFVTGGMVDRWTHAARTRGLFQLQELRDFQMMDPRIQQTQIQSGSGGSFGGFGGGGSGGGGAGGGW